MAVTSTQLGAVMGLSPTASPPALPALPARPCLLEGACADEEVGAGAGDEAQGVVPRLCVVPEVHVGVVEDVAVGVQVVEGLRWCWCGGHVG